MNLTLMLENQFNDQEEQINFYAQENSDLKGMLAEK